MMVLFKVLIGLTLILLLLLIGVGLSDNFDKFKLTQMYKSIIWHLDWILPILFIGAIIGGSYYIGDIIISLIKG